MEDQFSFGSDWNRAKPDVPEISEDRTSEIIRRYRETNGLVPVPPSPGDPDPRVAILTAAVHSALGAISNGDTAGAELALLRAQNQVKDISSVWTQPTGNPMVTTKAGAEENRRFYERANDWVVGVGAKASDLFDKARFELSFPSQESRAYREDPAAANAKYGPASAREPLGQVPEAYSKRLYRNENSTPIVAPQTEGMTLQL